VSRCAAGPSCICGSRSPTEVEDGLPIEMAAFARFVIRTPVMQLQSLGLNGCTPTPWPWPYPR
jgi:hypothetical protein